MMTKGMMTARMLKKKKRFCQMEGRRMRSRMMITSAWCMAKIMWKRTRLKVN